MSRDKAYEAVENFFEDSDAARTFAVEIVDAAFAAVGFDPDKTYYVHHKGTTLLTDYWVYDRDNQPNGWMKPVWLGKATNE